MLTFDSGLILFVWWAKITREEHHRRLAQKRAWNIAHLAKRRDQTRRAVRLWKQRHPELHRLRKKETRARHPEARKAIARRHYLKHYDKIRAAARIYRASHREEERRASRAYYRANREKVLTRDRLPHNRIRRALSSRISAAVRNHAKKAAHTAELLGCSMPHFRAHLASLFLPGMSFENYGKWELDHRVPCAVFDLTDPAQQRLCFHYTNLQPLWAHDNRVKHARLGGKSYRRPVSRSV